MDNRQKKYRFTTIFMVLSLTILLIPGVLGTLYTAADLNKSLSERIDRENTLTLEMVSEKLAHFFQEPVLELQFLNTMVAKADTPLAGFESMRTSGHHLQYFERLVLVDGNSDITAVWPENETLLGMNQSGKGFLEKLQPGAVSYLWSGTYVDYFSGATAIDLIVPLGEGYLAGTVLLDNLQGILDEMPGNTEAVIGIVDARGSYLAHSDSAKVSQRMKDPMIYGSLSKSEAVPATLEIEGLRYLSYSKNVEGTDWSIVSYYPWDKARAPVNHTLWDVITIQGITLLIIALLLFLMGQVLRKQIRKIEDFTKLIAEGHYNLTEPRSMFQEMDNILKHFEHMAEKVQDREMEIVSQNEEIFAMNEELESRVHERTLQLEAVNKELESFSYSVSHDLRAPLRHIHGFAGLLKSHLGHSADEKSTHYLSVIGEAASRMEQLIADLLAFSKMGRKEMLSRQVDNNALVREVVETIAPETEGHRIIWKIGALPVALGDEEMLRLVWTNLISNALKFSRLKEAALIEIGVIEGEKQAFESTYFVRDNGAGFNMQYKEKLFEIFQRLHRQEDFEGTGVGLAHVQRIIARHGGRIWAEGAVGSGAVFYFTLKNSDAGP